MKTLEPVSSASTSQIKVLLVENHALFRKSLKVLVELDGDIEVIAESKNGRDAVRVALNLHPDVILMDIGMPLLNGLQATQQIMEVAPFIRILILSAQSDAEYVRQAMLFGACGYLVKQSSTQVVAEAVRQVLKGKPYFSASITRSLRSECEKIFQKGEAERKKANHLHLPGHDL